jgi:hypothetical protein
MRQVVRIGRRREDAIPKLKTKQRGAGHLNYALKSAGGDLAFAQPQHFEPRNMRYNLT